MDFDNIEDYEGGKQSLNTFNMDTEDNLMWASKKLALSKIINYIINTVIVKLKTLFLLGNKWNRNIIK